MSVVLILATYAIVGMVVVETARIWFGMWWLEARVSTVLFWPIIALAALFGKHHES